MLLAVLHWLCICVIEDKEGCKSCFQAEGVVAVFRDEGVARISFTTDQRFLSLTSFSFSEPHLQAEGVAAHELSGAPALLRNKGIAGAGCQDCDRSRQPWRPLPALWPQHQHTGLHAMRFNRGCCII